MPGVLIAIAAAVLVAAAIWYVVRRSSSGKATPADAGPRTHPAPPVADFEVSGETATVSFDVPLPQGGADDVLRDLLVSEAIEVVREKRHQLPIDEVSRVVARGRAGEVWQEVGSVSLETPGELPPPATPVVIPGLGADLGFDPFDELSDLPDQAPGLAAGGKGDVLGPLAEELRMPAALEAGLRSQGIDPAVADAGNLVLGLLRLTGSTVTPKNEDTYESLGGGKRTMVRLVPHPAGSHPELGDAELRRFAADFATSGADRALLVTEKYGPFEVYDRERRDPRARYITRERVQQFIDAVALR